MNRYELKHVAYDLTLSLLEDGGFERYTKRPSPSPLDGLSIEDENVVVGLTIGFLRTVMADVRKTQVGAAVIQAHHEQLTLNLLNADLHAE